MFGSDILDVAIGLVLAYLLVSILMTSVVEAIEGLLSTRARDLELAIFQILQNDSALLEKFYNHPLIFSLYRGAYTAPPAAGSTEQGGAGLPARKGNCLPSYIPRESFAAAMLDIVAEGGAANTKFAEGLQAAARAVGFDPVRTRRELEGWFDAGMDRAASWFKRRTQARLFCLGLAVAVIANINSVTIGNYLAIHPAARDAAVAMAADLPETAPESIRSGTASQEERDQWLRSYREQLAEVALPIGWSERTASLTLGDFPRWASAGHPVSLLASLQGLLALLLLVGGYLATAFAVMLGAPFWFDLLNKLMIVRSTVKPKEKSPDEPPIGGKAAERPSQPQAPGGGETPEAPAALASPDQPHA